MNSSDGNLFKSGFIGGVKLKNRFVLLPMALESDDFSATKRLLDYYARVAADGAGLVEIGTVLVNDISQGPCKAPDWRNGIKCWDASGIPVMSDIAQTIAQQGSESCAQLSIHYESCLSKSVGVETIGPSAGYGGPFVGNSRALDIEEIGLLISQYGDAALRCKIAGISMVEIHAGAGYLLSRFLSPCTNHRNDRYGGNLENRMRMLREIVADCHDKAGTDYPVIVRLNVDDYMPGGNTLQDARIIMRTLEADGVAAFSLQAGFNESAVPLVNRFVPEDSLFGYIKELKREVGVPLIGSCRISTPNAARRAVRKAGCDYVGMARAFIADPEFVKKLYEGQEKAIRPCICCCRCLDESLHGRPIRCSVNPCFLSTDPMPANKKRIQKIVVIGAGPAGMEAARVAALAGAEVTIYEEQKGIGGCLNAARVLNPLLTPLLSYYQEVLSKAGVQIVLQSRMTQTQVQNISSDAVILAPGESYPHACNGNGNATVTTCELHNLFLGEPGRKTLRWIIAAMICPYVAKNSFVLGIGFKSFFLLGRRVFINGASYMGCETALFLSGRHMVTIADESEKVGRDIGPATRKSMLDALEQAGVAVLRGTSVLLEKPGYVVVKNLRTGIISHIPTDTMLVISNPELNHCWDESIAGSSRPMKIVEGTEGPAGEPNMHVPEWETAGRIRGAIHGGYEAAQELLQISSNAAELEEE